MTDARIVELYNLYPITQRKMGYTPNISFFILYMKGLDMITIFLMECEYYNGRVMQLVFKCSRKKVVYTKSYLFHLIYYENKIA